MRAAMAHVSKERAVFRRGRGAFAALLMACALAACGSVSPKTPGDGGAGMSGGGGDTGAAGGTSGTDGGPGTGGGAGTGGVAGKGGASGTGGGTGAGGAGNPDAGGVTFKGHINTIGAGATTGTIHVVTQKLGYDVVRKCNGSICFAGGIAP